MLRRSVDDDVVTVGQPDEGSADSGVEAAGDVRSRAPLQHLEPAPTSQTKLMPSRS